MEKAILTFDKGMVTDLDVTNRPQGSYELATNFSATPNGDGKLGTLNSAKGNGLVKSLPTGYIVVGSTIVNEIVVVFAVSDTGISRIYKETVFDEDLPGSFTLVYSDESSVSKLGFDVDYPIDAVGLYETENAIKVYWAQENQPLRYINLADSYTTSEANEFDIVPNYSQGSITVDSVIEGGSLKAGMVQYSYRLFKKYGAETSFSLPTSLYPLFSDTPNKQSEIQGNDKGDDINKSVKVNVTGIDTDFDYIRVYRIMYEDKDTPIITLVNESEIYSTSIQILDTGSTLDEVSLEVYNTLGGRVFNAKTIEYKDNILYAANITEENADIDIDCRAYRFDITVVSPIAGESRIYDSNDDYYKIALDGSWEKYNSSDALLTSGTAWTIPATADCINKYNDEFAVPVTTGSDLAPHPFNYQKDTTNNYGGTGPVVSYKFTTTTHEIMSAAHNTGFENATGQDLFLNKMSHKQGETYRYGITFYDKKNRPYFTKWIGDIRTPYIKNFIVEGLYLKGRNIYIEFTVDLSSGNTFVPSDILDTVSGYSISRVKLDDSNRSIAFQAATWEASVKDEVIYHTPFSESTRVANSRLSYIYSPELNLNGGYRLKGGGYRAKIVDAYTYSKAYLDTAYTIAHATYDYSVASSCTHVRYPYNKYASGSILLLDSMEVSDSSNLDIQEDGEAPYVVSAVGFSSQISNRVLTDDAAEGHTMYGPTCGILALNSTITNNLISYLPDYSTVIVDLYIDNFESKFGGILYSNRNNNVYVSVSEFESVTTRTSYVTSVEGDIHVTVYDALTSIADPNVDDTSDAVMADAVDRRQVVSLLPLESRVNCFLTFTKPSKYTLKNQYRSGGNLTSSFIGLQETVAKGISLYGDKYPSFLKDLTAYNTSYSTTPSFPTYASKPLIFDQYTKLHTTVVASEKKVNGEYVDSFTSFLYANVMEVDSTGGKINALKRVDNKLFFWQDNSFGIISVNDRYLIGEGVGQLALGSGGILERYDYISTGIGTERKLQIAATENELFWLNSKFKRIYSFGTDLKDLGIVKSVSSFITEHFGTLPIAIFDGIEYEVLFKLADGYVLVYDTRSNGFTGVYTYTPYHFTNLPDGNILSTDVGTDFYKHNSVNVNRANYYGTDNKSVISIIDNTDVTSVKVYDNLGWQSLTKGTGTVVLYESGAQINAFEPIPRYWNSTITGTTAYSTTFTLGSDAPLTEVGVFDSTDTFLSEELIIMDGAFASNTTFKAVVSMDAASIAAQTDATHFIMSRYMVPIPIAYGSHDVTYAPLSTSPTLLSLTTSSGDGYNVYDITIGIGIPPSSTPFTGSERAQPCSITYYNYADGDIVESFENVPLHESTFERYRVTDSYQNTDWQNLVFGDNLKRKEREFTAVVPRDIINKKESENYDIYLHTNLDSTQLFKRRIRDNFVRIELEKDNSTGEYITVPYIITKFRKSIR